MFRAPEPAYEKLASSEASVEDNAGPLPPSAARRDRRSIWTYGVLVFGLLCLSFISGLAALRQSGAGKADNGLAWPAKVPVPVTQCGSTPEEARRLGCRFEIHNFAWVPPQCYDEALADDWDSHQTWVFARSSRNGSDTDDDFVAQCRAGNVHAAWVPWWQHMAHCDLILKKYMRSVMFFRPMDNWTSNWPHNEHCSRMLARFNVDPWLYNSDLHLKFPTCDYAWLESRADPRSAQVAPAWHGNRADVVAPYCHAGHVVYENDHVHEGGHIHGGGHGGGHGHEGDDNHG